MRPPRRGRPPFRTSRGDRAAAEHAGERLAEGDPVAFHGDVDVEVRLTHEHVAHRAADEVDAVERLADRLHGLEDRLEMRECVQLVGDAHAGACHPSPCGSSSARRKSLRATTPTTFPLHDGDTARVGGSHEADKLGQRRVLRARDHLRAHHA